MLEPIITALTTTGSGRWEVLVEARKENPDIFLDYRILPKFIDGLGDGYSEISFMIGRWIMEYGKMMIEPLKKGFDPMGKSEMYLRFDIIADLAKEEENDFYLSVINGEARKDIRKRAIRSLKYSEDNIDFLIELATTADKASKTDAIETLKTFKNPKAVEFLKTVEVKKK